MKFINNSILLALYETLSPKEAFRIGKRKEEQLNTELNTFFNSKKPLTIQFTKTDNFVATDYEYQGNASHHTDFTFLNNTSNKHVNIQLKTGKSPSPVALTQELYDLLKTNNPKEFDNLTKLIASNSIKNGFVFPKETTDAIQDLINPRENSGQKTALNSFIKKIERLKSNDISIIEKLNNITIPITNNNFKKLIMFGKGINEVDWFVWIPDIPKIYNNILDFASINNSKIIYKDSNLQDIPITFRIRRHSGANSSVLGVPGLYAEFVLFKTPKDIENDRIKYSKIYKKGI